MSQSAAASGPPTRVRYYVLAFACALGMIAYLDRFAFSNSRKQFQDALGLTSIADLKVAMTAFAIAYALFEIPAGWLGDRFGPRGTLIKIALWWSFFTALAGMAGLEVAGITLISLGGLVAVQFLFGMGQAGVFPNITRALHNWFPLAERGIAQGCVWMCSRLMGGLTPLIWVVLVEHGVLHWRSAFYLFGAVGVVWVIAFAAWFRNRPEEKPQVNDAELAVIRAGTTHEVHSAREVPWGKLLASRTLWALCLSYFCMAYGWYFNLFYLPTYLEQQHGVDPKSLWGGIYKGGPLLLGAFGCLLGGYLTDRYVRRTGDRRWGRRTFGLIGFGLAGCLMLTCLYTGNPETGGAALFALSMSLAAFCNDLAMGASSSTCQDIGKRYAAIVAGAMNMVGNIGGAVVTYASGYVLGWKLDEHAASLGRDVKDLTEAEKAAGLFPGYEINFLMFGLAYFVGMGLWFLIDASKPVAPEAVAEDGPAGR